MRSSLRSRLDRLERAPRDTESTGLPPRFWDILAGGLNWEDLDDAEYEQLLRFCEQAEAEHARCLESQPVGVLYREQLARLGLPQPATLAGVDLIEETIRLAGIRSPDGRSQHPAQRFQAAAPE
jgi:hypothetical protein